MTFGFFRRSCPVDAETRSWVDRRMKWLADEFGLESWWHAKAIEPTDAYFPDRFDSSEHAVRRMLDRVCSFMGIEPERVALRLYSEVRNADLGPGHHIQGGGTAGQYIASDKDIVRIESSGLNDTMALVATMAHELAHVRLLGEKRLSGDEEDHEPLTDLATVFFGLGIFNANSVIRYKQWTKGQWYGWSSGRLGYLDEPTFGYALALWSYVRGESHPHWMRHLRPNVRVITKKSLQFLRATTDSPFSTTRRPRV
jgi:hypothetical protein